MLLWEKEIPKYLTERRNVVGFILFTAVFALIFINIYEPFGSQKWGDVSQVQFFFLSSMIILIGMLIVVFSRLLMYIITRQRPIRYGAYALWIFGEIFSMALVFSIIQYYYLKSGDDFSVILGNSVRNTALVILLPYIISWLYLSFKDKYRTVEELMSERSANELSGTSIGKSVHGNITLMPFRDEKGLLKFSIKKDDVLYLEAADNYVIIHYIDNEKIARFVLRNTLKNLESDLRHSRLLRSHRSFMVNMDRVKMIKKEKDGLIVGFDAPVSTSIPISKTYVDNFIKNLSVNTIEE